MPKRLHRTSFKHLSAVKEGSRLSSCCLLLQFTALMLSLALSVQSLRAQSLEGTLILVNQGDGDISLVDPGEDKEVARISEGAIAGHEVATSLDGRTAYVPIYGDSVLGRAGSNGREVAVIDLASRKVVHRVDLGHGVRPHCIVMNAHDGLLYLTTELDRTVTIIDPVSLKIVGTIRTNQDESHMLAISSDGRFGYTANVGPGTVSVLDLRSRTLVRVIPVSGEVQRISISPDNSMVFTADQKEPRMAVIDTTTNAVKTWIPLPAIGYGTSVTRDGKWLLVTLPDASKIAVVDLKTMQVAQTVAVPKGPHSVLVSPDGRTAFVSCMASGEVAVIRLGDWSVQARVKVGNNADGIGWATRSN